MRPPPAFGGLGGAFREEVETREARAGARGDGVDGVAQRGEVGGDGFEGAREAGALGAERRERRAGRDASHRAAPFGVRAREERRLPRELYARLAPAARG